MNEVDDIDLNINNYDINSLITFFDLNDKKINENNLEEKKNKIYDVLLNDNQLILTKKKNLLDFTNKAYNKLLIYINNDSKNNNEGLINNNTITDNIDLSNLYSDKKINDDDYYYTTSDNTNKLNNHPIVKKPYTKFIYSDVNSAFDGIINPLEKRISTKIICLDTRFRENFCNTNSNNFTIHLSTPLENVISMKLVSFEIPRLWYSISSVLKNNTFKIYLYNMNTYADNVQTIVMPDGNYNNTLLTQLINNYFTNIGNGLNYLSFGVNIATGKSTFFVKSDPSVDTILPYDASNSYYSPKFYYKIDFLNCEGFGFYLGYSNIIYTADKNKFNIDNFNATPAVTYYGTIVSESSCGSNLDNYIFIDINDFNKNFNTNTIISQKDNSFIGNNILGKIILSLPDTLILNNAADNIFKKREYYGPVRIKKLQISLLNKYGYLIDLLNNNYSISLEFNILYS